jgi:HEAT repeat protein
MSQNGSAETPQQSVDAAWNILKYGFDDKSPEQRTKAAHALGLLQNNARAQTMVETALTDANAEVRASACTALGQMDAKSSIPKLHHALKDSQLKVVIAAANSLYIFKDPIAYDIYYTLLTGERKGPGLLKSQMDTLKDKKQLEKMVLETGIGFIPFGGMGYEAYKTITKNDSSLIRVAAVGKLATDPDPKTTQALGKACSDKDWRVRVAVVETIAKRGNPELLFSLTPLLYDNSDDVRYESAAAVIRLSTPPPPAPKPPAKTPAKRKRI